MSKIDLQVHIKSERVEYLLTLKRKLTILTGMSASSKTTMCEAIRDNYSTIITCDKPVFVLEPTDINTLLYTLSSNDAVYVIDETAIEADWFQKIDYNLSSIKSYIIVITRDTTPNMTYSVDAICYLEESSDGNIIMSSKPLYPVQYLSSKVDGIIIEGAPNKSESTFYKNYCNLQVLNASGKNKVLRLLLNNKNYLAIPDREAYGYNIRNLYNYSIEFGLSYWLPISFEQMLYSAWSLCDDLPSKEDCWGYKSLEHYYTDILSKYASKCHDRYSKSRLPACIHDPSVVDNFKKLFPDELQYLFKEDKLQWCRDNAPDSLKDLSDSELLEIMDSAWRHRDD